MTLGEHAFRHGELHAIGQLKQPHRVRDRRPGPTHTLGELLMREPEVVDELPISERGLDGIKILALEVLDEGELKLLPIGQLADHRRDPIQPDGDRRSETPLAGHQLIPLEGLGHEDRLDHPVLANARDQGGKRRVIDPLAWLVRVRSDPSEGDLCVAPADRHDAAG